MEWGIERSNSSPQPARSNQLRPSRYSSSSVRKGRCDFYERFGDSNSLPILDVSSTEAFPFVSYENAYCKCIDVFEDVSLCGASTFLPGVSLVNVDEEGARSCGLCPQRKPLFHSLCDDGYGDDEGHCDHGDHSDHRDMDDMDGTSVAVRSTVLGLVIALFILECSWEMAIIFMHSTKHPCGYRKRRRCKTTYTYYML
jgi:hypothetical protein